ELKPGPVEVESLEGDDPDADLDQGDQRRERANPLPRQREEPERERSGDREADQDRGQPVRHRVARKTTARTATPVASASAYERTSPFWMRLTSPAPKRKLRVTSPIEPATIGCSKNRPRPREIRTAGL